MSNDLSVTPPLLPGIMTAPIDTKVSTTSDESLFTRRLGAGMAMPGAIGEILGSIGHSQTSSGPDSFGGALVKKEQDDEDEEL
jgi:hypothetical protein